MTNFFFIHINILKFPKLSKERWGLVMKLHLSLYWNKSPMLLSGFFSRSISKQSIRL